MFGSLGLEVYFRIDMGYGNLSHLHSHVCAMRNFLKKFQGQLER